MHKSRQLELPWRVGHGGARKGAGRKRQSEKACVSHMRKSGFAKLKVLHVTCKLLPGLASLRDPRIAVILMAYLARCCERQGFRIVEFSIQENHVHLICEAESQEELSRAMQGLMSGMARTLNRELGRRGTIFADRYHAEPISNPTQCRNTLLYVLANGRKHGVLHPSQRVDPWSTARWFPFTRADVDSPGHQPKDETSHAAANPQGPESAGPKPAATAQSWLLQQGWRLGGSIHMHDHPKPPKQRRRANAPQQRRS